MSDKADPPLDPVIETRIDRTLRKYEGKATPDMLRVMREQLRELLSTHPVAVGLLEQVRKVAVPIASHEQVRDGAEDDEAGGGKGDA